MAGETGIQSQVESYQRLKEWYLIPPCLKLSIIRYVSRVKWSNPEKGIAPSPTPRCSTYWKGSFQVTLDCGCQLYFYFIQLLVFDKNTWNHTTVCKLFVSVKWYQVFLSNTINLYTVTWYQVFQSNANNTNKQIYIIFSNFSSKWSASMICSSIFVFKNSIFYEKIICFN